MRIGVVRSYQINETDAMTYMAAAGGGLEFNFVGTRPVKMGSLGSFVHEDTEEGYQSILDQNYDILDVPDPMYPWACWLAERHPKVVCTVWENLAWKMLQPDWYKLLGKAALVVARSPLTYSCLADFFVPREKLELIAAGVDCEAFLPKSKRWHSVTYVGRLTYEKGLLDLLFAAIGQDWHLAIVGDGPARESLEAMAQVLQLTARFTGQLPHTAIPGVLGESDVFIYGSWPTVDWQEQFGVSVIEAAACGCKIVLSHQSVFEYFAQCIPGIRLYAPGDYVGLRERINEALISPLPDMKYNRFDARLIGKQIREAYGRLG